MKRELAALSGSSRAICHQPACPPASSFHSFCICMLRLTNGNVGFALQQEGWQTSR